MRNKRYHHHKSLKTGSFDTLCAARITPKKQLNSIEYSFDITVFLQTGDANSSQENILELYKNIGKKFVNIIPLDIHYNKKK